MLVTVGICTWNRADLLRRTLENLEQLQVPARLDWELLVVDNNSTDATADVLKGYAGRLPLRALFEPKQGQSAARNRILREARGEILLWTDDDVRPAPDWIEATCRAFDDSQVGIVFGVLRPLWLGERPTWFGDQFLGNFALLDYGSTSFVVESVAHPFYGANHAARTGILRTLGGYREDLGLVGHAGGGEDMDLFGRALKAGVKIVYEPAAVVEHMIEGWRCTRHYHRRRTWLGCGSYYQSLVTDAADVPWLFGVPRYLVRQASDHALRYVRAVANRDRSEAFYRELKLIQFVGLARHAVRHALARRTRDRAPSSA